jgi:hypothetical protein
MLWTVKISLVVGARTSLAPLREAAKRIPGIKIHPSLTGHLAGERYREILIRESWPFQVAHVNSGTQCQKNQNIENFSQVIKTRLI